MSQTIAFPAVVFTGTAAPLGLAVADAKKHVSGLDSSVLASQEKWARNYKAQAASLRGTLVGGLTAGVSGAASYAIGEVIGGGIKELGVGSVKAAADVETLKLGLDTLLGSATKADAMLADIRAFAADSPLGFSESAQMAKQLTAVGVAADQVIPSLRALSDIGSGVGGASGVQETVKNLVDAYAKIKTDGRLYGDQLNRFTGAGIPLIEALAQAMDKPAPAIRKMVEEGEVGFPQVTKALSLLTTEGIKSSGRLITFAGIGEKYAESTAGAFDRLGDAYQVLRAEFGKALIDELDLKGGARDLEGFVDRLKSGVGEIRPALFFLGNLGRAAANVGNELAKAAQGVAGGLFGELSSRFPGLQKAGEMASKIVEDLKAARIRPEAAKEFGALLGDVTGEVFQGVYDIIKSAGLDLKKDVFDPMVSSIKDVRAALDEVKAIIDSIKAARAEIKDGSDKMRALAAGTPLMNGAPAGPAAQIARLKGGDNSAQLEAMLAAANQSGEVEERARLKGLLAAEKTRAAALPPAPPPIAGQPATVAPQSPARQATDDAIRRADSNAASRKLGRDPLATLGPLALGLGASSPLAALSQAALGVKGLTAEATLLTPKIVALADRLKNEFAADADPVGFKRLGDINLAHKLGQIDGPTRDSAGASLLESLAKKLPEFKPAPNADYGSAEAARLVQEAMGGRSESVAGLLQNILDFMRQSEAENRAKGDEFRKAQQVIAQKVLEDLGKTPIRIR